MEQTIAQKLGITKFPFIIKNDVGQTIYEEGSTGYWIKSEYDKVGNKIRWKDSIGDGKTIKITVIGNITEHLSKSITSPNDWELTIFKNNKSVYFENGNGIKTGRKPSYATELTMEEIATRLGIDVKDLKIVA